MLTLEDIDRLLSFDGGDAWVLSAYLDLDAARRIKRSYLIAFEDLIKSEREELAEPARDHFAREVARVRAWLEDQEASGKWLALICCSPKNFWQAHVLPVRITEHLAFERRTETAPLL